MTDRQQLYREFWAALTDEVETRGASFSPRGPYDKSNLTYLNSPLGRSGVVLNFNISQERVDFFAGVRIKDDKALYEQLRTEHEAIHDEVGRTVAWMELGETNDRYKIGDTLRADVSHRDRWDEYIDWFITTGDAITNAVRPRL